MGAFAQLGPAEIAESMAHRIVIEQAKGMLMFAYGIDAERAFELLRWRSQTTNVKLRTVALRLTEELGRPEIEGVPAARSKYDAVLLDFLRPRPAGPAVMPLE